MISVQQSNIKHKQQNVLNALKYHIVSQEMVEIIVLTLVFTLSDCPWITDTHIKQKSQIVSFTSQYSVKNQHITHYNSFVKSLYH